MAWRTPGLQLEILALFANLSGSGWDVEALGSPFDPDEPELSITQRVRQRRAEFAERLKLPAHVGRKKKAAAR